MKRSDFNADELSAIRFALDFMEYEMEDYTGRPSGWTYKKYLAVFSNVYDKLSGHEDAEFSSDDTVLLSFVLRVYMETKELHGIHRSIPEGFEAAVAARRKILSQLYA